MDTTLLVPSDAHHTRGSSLCSLHHPDDSGYVTDHSQCHYLIDQSQSDAVLADGRDDADDGPLDYWALRRRFSHLLGHKQDFDWGVYKAKLSVSFSALTRDLQNQTE